MATENAQLTYLELISKDEKQVKREELSIKAQEAYIEVQREIMNINSKIAAKKQSITKAQRQIPYSVRTEYLLSKELQALEESLEFVKEIKENRFNDTNV